MTKSRDIQGLDTTALRSRPRVSDVNVRSRAATLLLEDVKSWPRYSGLLERSSPETYEQMLCQALSGRDDGYDIAEYLALFQAWPSDAALVAILDGAALLKRAALAEAEAAWVLDNAITLAFPLGTWVATPSGCGPVSRCLPKTARYVVAIEPAHRATPGCGHVIPAEDCVILNDEAGS